MINWLEPENEEQASGHYDLNYAENRPTTRYFYDGQMPMEEDYNPSGSITKVTRNTLGGRGIDMISTTQSSTTTLAFPLYDGHGNMVATLSRGSSSYSVGNQRTYDVWGSVRSGSATGDPTKRYVVSIGHQADDESDLIYMRARYYEPGTGRFVSEDPANHDSNWFVYCGNEPVLRSDPTGQAFIFNMLVAVQLNQLLQRIAALGGAAALTGVDRMSQVLSRSPLANWLIRHGEHADDLLEWYYVRGNAKGPAGETILVKAFVRLTENQMVVKVLIDEQLDGDPALRHVSPYLHNIVKGSPNIFVDPSKL